MTGVQTCALPICPVSKLILPVTLYVNAGILPECKASNIAAEFKTLLENPVLLLL